MRIGIEWQDAPGVRDEALARTWGRFSLQGEGRVPLVALVDDGQYREGIYLSLLPLALWLTENYWSVLWEPVRAPVLRSSRQLGKMDALRPWVQRHSLLAARGGFMLPDLTIARDGTSCVLRVAPDPPGAQTQKRFIADHVLRVRWQDLRSEVHRVVEAVLERLRGQEGIEPAVLRTNWTAVVASESDSKEAALCRWLAMAGMDPYGDADEIDPVVALLSEFSQTGALGILTQILPLASGVGELRKAVGWVRHVAQRHQLVLVGEPALMEESAAFQPAHEVGYARAFELRRELRLGESPVALEEVLPRFGMAPGVTVDGAGCPPSVSAVVAQRSGLRIAEIVGPQYGYVQDRFRLARAFYMWHFCSGSRSAQLVGLSHDRVQRESRAFAAEFLAPWTGIQKSLRQEEAAEMSGLKVLRRLARKYEVDVQVIERQMQNHDDFREDWA